MICDLQKALLLSVITTSGERWRSRRKVGLIIHLNLPEITCVKLPRNQCLICPIRWCVLFSVSADCSAACGEKPTHFAVRLRVDILPLPGDIAIRRVCWLVSFFRVIIMWNSGIFGQKSCKIREFCKFFGQRPCKIRTFCWFLIHIFRAKILPPP